MTLSHNRGRFSVVIEVGSVKNHRRITEESQGQVLL